MTLSSSGTDLTLATTDSSNLTISPSGNLVLDSTGGTIDINDATIDLATQATNIDIIGTNTAALTFESGLLRLDTQNTAVEVTGTTNLGDGGTTNYAQFNATGDLTFVGSADTITGPSGAALTVAAGAGRALTLTGNATSTWSTTAGGINIDAVTDLSIDVTGATGASNISVAANADAEDLTIETTGSAGDLIFNSVDDITINAADNTSVILTDYVSCTALETNGSGVLTCGTDDSGGVANYWQLSADTKAMAPYNVTLDILLGSNATSSAKMAFINMAGGTPTATISANSGNNAQPS